MKTITPLHSRANVIPRADIHASLHELMFHGGDIDTELFGRVNVGATIQYQTPARRNSFAFGQVAALGTRDRALTEDANGIEPGDIIGFDLFQTGHQLDASSYYENAPWFVTLPWKEILCRFTTKNELPLPVGWWLMVEPDPIATRRLVFGDGGGGLYLPGSIKGGLATNANSNTKVRMCAAKLVSAGFRAAELCSGVARIGDWVLYNPIDAVDIDYAGGRKLAFVKWDDAEQVVSADR